MWSCSRQRHSSLLTRMLSNWTPGLSMALALATSITRFVRAFLQYQSWILMHYIMHKIVSTHQHPFLFFCIRDGFERFSYFEDVPGFEFTTRLTPTSHYTHYDPRWPILSHFFEVIESLSTLIPHATPLYLLQIAKLRFTALSFLCSLYAIPSSSWTVCSFLFSISHASE